MRRGPLHQSLKPTPPSVDSKANQIQAYKTARVREVAYELSLPFALEALQGHAERGVEKARETYDGKSGQVDWLLHLEWHIYKAVAQGGTEEQAQVGRRPAPKGEHIREALTTFCDPKTDPKKWEWNWEHLLKDAGTKKQRRSDVTWTPTETNLRAMPW